MAIIEGTRVVVDRATFTRTIGFVHGVRVLLLQGHVVLLPWEPLGVWVLAVRAHVLVVLGCLVRIVRLLLQRGPTLFTDERIAVLLVLLGIVLEEGRGGRRLGLVMVAGVSADVLALIEFVVVLHVLLHGLADGVVLVVVHDVSVGYVLGMDAAASLDHRKLLGVEVLVRVRGKASSHWLLVVLLVVATGGQVRQLLLRLAELLVMLLLVGVDPFDLVRASDLHFCSVAAHVVRMLAVLGEAVCESGPYT